MSKFVKVECNDGEYNIVMALEEETADTIKGITVYTSSAYEDAIVSDRFEAGRPILVNKEKYGVTAVNPITDEKYINDNEKTLEEGIALRNKYKGLLIESDAQVMQAIVLEQKYNGFYEKDEIAVTFQSSLPKTKAADGLPMITEGYYYVGSHTTEENVRMALTDRNDYVSTSGDFLPETKIIVSGEVVGTLADCDLSKLPFDNELKASVKILFDTIKKTELDKQANEMERE